MPIHPETLSVFFDRLSDELHKQWDDSVDDGNLTDQAMHRRVKHMEEIGAILRALSEGNAVLTFKHRKRREPAPMIVLPREEE